MSKQISILEISEEDLKGIFKKDGSLTSKIMNFFNSRQRQILAFLKNSGVTNRSEFETLKAKATIEKFEKENGKININQITNVYTKQGRLTRRKTKANAKIVELLNKIGAEEVNDYQLTMIKIGTINQKIKEKEQKEIENKIEKLVKANGNCLKNYQKLNKKLILQLNLKNQMK